MDATLLPGLQHLSIGSSDNDLQLMIEFPDISNKWAQELDGHNEYPQERVQCVDPETAFDKKPSKLQSLKAQPAGKKQRRLCNAGHAVVLGSALLSHAAGVQHGVGGGKGVMAARR